MTHRIETVTYRKDIFEVTKYYKKVAGKRMRYFKQDDGTTEKIVIKGWDEKKDVYLMDYLIHTLNNHDPVLILFHSNIDLISRKYLEEIRKFNN